MTPNIKRRYFEVFGDLEEEIRFLRRTAFCLAGILLVLICFLFQMAKKPPIVIRVSEVQGAQAIRDLPGNNAPTPQEMIGFSKRFVLRYTGYNSYTVSRDMTEALNQMTSRFQKDTQKKMIDSGFLARIAQAGINTEIEFKESKVERDSEDAGLVSIIGVRRIAKYGLEGLNQDVLFRADLVLKKVSRSNDVPEGLLVEEYREMLLNELTERKQS